MFPAVAKSNEVVSDAFSDVIRVKINDVLI